THLTMTRSTSRKATGWPRATRQSKVCCANWHKPKPWLLRRVKPTRSVYKTPECVTQAARALEYSRKDAQRPPRERLSPTMRGRHGAHDRACLLASQFGERLRQIGQRGSCARFRLARAGE